jgi:hypothetical protein
VLYRYNKALQDYLLKGHYLDSREYHTLMGSELIDRLVTRNVRASLSDVAIWAERSSETTKASRMTHPRQRSRVSERDAMRVVIQG